MRKDNNRKVEQTERFSIDEDLHSLDKEDLFAKKICINDELLMEYWSNAREIISEYAHYETVPC